MSQDINYYFDAGNRTLLAWSAIVVTDFMVGLAMPPEPHNDNTAVRSKKELMNSNERRERRYQRRKAGRDAKRANLNLLFGDYEKVFSFDNLYRAYKKCCLGVGWKASTQTYRFNALLNVNKTHNQLMTDKFKSKGFYEFKITERGKTRHISSVHISERVVQRCLCDNALVPMLTKSFIYDNGASLQGKGIHFTINRLKAHFSKHFRQHGNEGYALVIDFSKFFDRIPHHHLFAELQRRFDDERIISITKQLIADFGNVGLGLGSQVSQTFALGHPNKLDHYIKEKLGIKFYARYMDDSYLIHHDKEYLKFCLAEIQKICDELGIVLNPRKTQIIKLSRGLPFLQARFFLTESGRIIKICNKKSVTRMRRKLKKFRNWLDTGRFTMDDIRTSFMSWKGHIKHFNSYHSMRNLEKVYHDLYGDENRINFYL